MSRSFCYIVTAVCLFSAPTWSAHASPWPAIKEFGGATPKNLDSWIGIEDYPVEALRKKAQGNVIVMFDITIDGKARNCKIETPSGIRSLDSVPCKLIERKAKFKPAMGKNGVSVETKGRYSVAFWIPE